MDIRLEHIYKSFQDKRVISDFSAVFPEGRISCIMGASGKGKTTLLNIMLGFTKADRGNISGVPEHIGVVFQDDRLCEDFSAIENIRLVSGKKRSRADIELSLKKLGLCDNDIYTPVRTLSGGMKRRVALARTLEAENDALFLDEPFKGLDDESKHLAMKYLLEKAGKRTVILITHDRSEALYLKAEITEL